jgi:hypothetical protein
VVLLLARRAGEFRPVLCAAFAWVFFTLLPVSFLTYMPFVPSRHTYMASAGLALVAGCGLLAALQINRKLVAALAVAMLVHNWVYLWTKKYDQMLDRAKPTEEIVALAESTNRRVYIHCFPYSMEHAILAVTIRTHRPRSAVVWDPNANRVRDGAAFFCWEKHLVIEHYQRPVPGD